MPFSHVPKLSDSLLVDLTWCGSGDPRNTMRSSLAAGVDTSSYVEASNFTRYYGTVSSDVSLEVEFAYANEERVHVPKTYRSTVAGLVVDLRLPSLAIRKLFPVDLGGFRDVTDEDLATLNYDGVVSTTRFTPGHPPKGSHFFVIISGRWLRVRVTNVGDIPASWIRTRVRGSVF